MVRKWSINQCEFTADVFTKIIIQVHINRFCLFFLNVFWVVLNEHVNEIVGSECACNICVYVVSTCVRLCDAINVYMSMWYKCVQWIVCGINEYVCILWMYVANLCSELCGKCMLDLYKSWLMHLYKSWMSYDEPLL